MKNGHLKRMLSLLLTFVMLLSMLPAAVAEETADAAAGEEADSVAADIPSAESEDPAESADNDDLSNGETNQNQVTPEDENGTELVENWNLDEDVETSEDESVYGEEPEADEDADEAEETEEEDQTESEEESSVTDADVFIIDPTVAYPEPNNDEARVVTAYEVFEDGSYVAFNIDREELFEGLDTEPYGKAWVDPATLIAYAEQVVRAEAALTEFPDEEEVEIQAAGINDALSDETLSSEDEQEEPTTSVTLEEAIAIWENATGESVSLDESEGDFFTAANSQTLPTPTNVKWSDVTKGNVQFDYSGSINWNAVTVRVEIYKNNTSWQTITYWCNVPPSGNTIILDTSHHDFESGDYYFTVQLISEVSSVKSSGIASSGVFHYTAPSGQLGIPQEVYRLEKDNTVYACWNTVSGAGGYDVEFTSQDNSFQGFCMVWDGSATQTQFPFLTANRRGFKYTGALGKLSVRVRSLSPDITQIRHSEYSSWQTKRSGKYLYQSAFLEYGGYANTRAYYTYNYDESWFNKSSYEYNQDLVRMSIRMAMAAADTTPDNIENLMQQLGFTFSKKYSSYPNPPGTDTIGYAIGSKVIKRSNGTSFTLVAVTPRGGGYKKEWASNFAVGAGTTHYGFNHAANMVVDAVKKYLKSEVSGEVKLWIAGYSRGAATSNLAAYKLTAAANRGDINGLAPDGIYAFCFECPATVIDYPGNQDYKSDVYKNICCFLNDIDPVAQVPSSAWDYDRIGVVYNLPSPSTTSKFNTSYGKMTSKYLDIANKTISRSPGSETDKATHIIFGQAGILKTFIGAVSRLLGGVIYSSGLDAAASYAYGYQDIFEGVGESMGEDDPELIDIIKKSLKEAAISSIPVLGIADNELFYIRAAHYPELSLAWMDVINNNTEYVSTRSRNLKTNCPVNVTVFDSRGIVVAQIVNDQPVEIEGSFIGAYVDENGQKIINLPPDEDYTFEFTPTDDGMMSVQVEEYDVNGGKTLRLVNYYDIDIEEGKPLSGTAGETGDEAGSYTIKDAENNPVAPISDLSGDEIKNYSVSVETAGQGFTSGGGVFLVGEFASVVAEADAGWTFMGWYEGEGDNKTLVSDEPGMRFRVDGNKTLTAVFRENLSEIVLDREYLALDAGNTAQLSATCVPQEWQEYLKWRIENAKGEEGTVAEITEDGRVTAAAPGTAYAVAYVDYSGQTATARCRIDVAGENGDPVPVTSVVEGAALLNTQATVTLYSKSYSVVSVILALPQNYTIQDNSEGVDAADGNGVAITNAYFSDPNTRDAFRLKVLDDRSLQVIPRAEVLNGTLGIQKSYESAIIIDFGNDQNVVTDNTLRIAVDTKIPTVKAKGTVTFDSFEKNNAQPVLFTNPDVAAIRIDETKDGNAQWLTVVEGELSLKLNSGITGKQSGKINLLATIPGWAVEIPVAVTVKAAPKTPQLKLSASTITVQEDIVNSDGVSLSLKSGQKSVSIADLNLLSVQVPGFDTENFDPETGSFVLKCSEAPIAGKTALTVSFRNSDSIVTIPLTVKIQKVVPTLSSKTVSLIAFSTDQAGLKLGASPTDYRFNTPILKLTDSKGMTTYAEGEPDEAGYLQNDELLIRYLDGTVYLSVPEESDEGDCPVYPTQLSYKLHVRLYEEGSEAVADIKILNTWTTKVKMSAKASGSIDLAYPDSVATVSYSFKNFNSAGTENTWIYIEGRKGSKIVDFDATEKFSISSLPNGFRITAADIKDLDPSLTYYACLEQKVSKWTSATATVKLPVKNTAVTVKASSTKLVMNIERGDTASITLTASKKGYSLDKPIFDITNSWMDDDAYEQLDLLLENGILHIQANDRTKLETEYTISVRAAEKCKPTLITVSIPEAGKPIGAQLKASGKIDIIRPNSTSIILTPTYSGCSGNGEYEQEVEVFVNGENVSEKFTAIRNNNGSFTVRLKNGEELNWQKNTVCYMNLVLDGAIPSDPVKASIVMGSAKVKLNQTVFSLPSVDRFSTMEFSVTANDNNLSEVNRVEFADVSMADIYRIVPLGANRFALGFKDNLGSLPRTDKAVKLNVFFTGNASQTPNCTVSVNVTVK